VTRELFNAKQLRPQRHLARASPPYPWPCQWDFRAQRLRQHDVIVRSSAAVIPKVILRELMRTGVNYRFEAHVDREAEEADLCTGSGRIGVSPHFMHKRTSKLVLYYARGQRSDAKNRPKPSRPRISGQSFGLFNSPTSCRF